VTDELDSPGPNWSEVRDALEELQEDIQHEHETQDLRDYAETLYELERAIDHYDHALQSYHITQGDYNDGDG